MALPITLFPGRKKKQLGPVGVTILGVLLLIGGLAAVGFGVIQPLVRERAAQTWEQVPCTIVTSDVSSSKHKGRTRYRPEISFRYEHAGASYVSNEFALSDWKASGLDSAHAVVARYTPGSSAQCFVDPAEPSTAVIVREIESIWLPLGLSVVFIGLGAFLLLRVATGAVRPVPAS